MGAQLRRLNAPGAFDESEDIHEKLTFKLNKNKVVFGQWAAVWLLKVRQVRCLLSAPCRLRGVIAFHMN